MVDYLVLHSNRKITHRVFDAIVFFRLSERYMASSLISHSFLSLILALKFPLIHSNVGAIDLNVPSPGVCPEATFICTAESLNSSNLRWFLNDYFFATYAIILSHQYPFSLEPQNLTYSTLVGGVDIQILEANPNENNPDIVSFRSSITFNNISQLQVAGISVISCGQIRADRRDYANVEFNSSQG